MSEWALSVSPSGSRFVVADPPAAVAARLSGNDRAGWLGSVGLPADASFDAVVDRLAVVFTKLLEAAPLGDGDRYDVVEPLPLPFDG